MHTLFRSKATASYLGFAVFLLGMGSAFAQDRRVPSTAAYSTVSPNYVRERLADGSWKRETYVFGEGDLIDRSGEDESLTALSFHEMCEILANALYLEDYLPAPVADEANLLIVVSWGKTMPHADQIGSLSVAGMSNAVAEALPLLRDLEAMKDLGQPDLEGEAAVSSQIAALEAQMDSYLMVQEMSERGKHRANVYNARLLGFTPALMKSFTTVPVGPQRGLFEDLLEELEVSRYFVILQVYDFQKLRQHKERDLRWVARFSIRAKDRSFDKDLEAMAAAASTVFGQPSGDLKRNLRPGRGRIGEVELVEE